MQGIRPLHLGIVSKDEPYRKQPSDLFSDYPPRSDFLFTAASIDELGSEIKERFAAALFPGEPICQILIAPWQVRRIKTKRSGSRVRNQLADRWRYEWVMVLTAAKIVFLDAIHPSDEARLFVIPIQNLVSIEWGRILLNSWVEWSWIDGNRIDHARMEYTTTGEKPVNESIAYLHGSDSAHIGGSYLPQSPSMQALKALPYDFTDRLPLLLAPGEQILQIVYSPDHPSSLKPHQSVFKRAAQRGVPPSAIILTDRQIIFIHEEEDDTVSRLGEVIQTVPVARIKQIDEANGLEGVQIHLVVGDACAEENLLLRSGGNSNTSLIASCRERMSVPKSK